MILKIDNITEQQLKNLMLFLDSPENLIHDDNNFMQIMEGGKVTIMEGHNLKKAILLKANRESDDAINSFSLAIKIYDGYRIVDNSREPFQIKRTVIEGVLDALERFPRD